MTFLYEGKLSNPVTTSLALRKPLSRKNSTSDNITTSSCRKCLFMFFNFFCSMVLDFFKNKTSIWLSTLWFCNIHCSTLIFFHHIICFCTNIAAFCFHEWHQCASEYLFASLHNVWFGSKVHLKRDWGQARCPFMGGRCHRYEIIWRNSQETQQHSLQYLAVSNSRVQQN